MICFGKINIDMKLYELITEKAIRISNYQGDTDVVLLNPSKFELMNWLNNRPQKKDRFNFSAKEEVHIKGLVNKGDIYVWNAYWAGHSGAFKLLSLSDWDNTYFFYVTYNSELKGFVDIWSPRKASSAAAKSPKEISNQIKKLFQPVIR